MSEFGSVAVAVASLIVLAAMFRPLELAFPARSPQAFFRPAWWTDLGFFVGQYLFWNALLVTILLAFRDRIEGLVPESFRLAVTSQPFWLQVAVVMLSSDFLIYWGHRLQHRVDFLWRFHAVHHSAEHLDWLAAHREHPLDSIYTLTLVNLPAFVFGLPVSAISALIVFRGVWAIFLHSNVRMPLGPLKFLFGAPQLHHWHHDRDRDAGNYGNLSPLMDWLFGTYKCPDHEPDRVGLSRPMPQSYWKQLVHPLLPRSWHGRD
jgi:sterol desaturase/sphingolipid hydroxylase (fatty acid hydroxylase superfamily)